MTSPSPALLDLRGTPCPLNFIRSRLALEKLAPGDRLEIRLDRGEPEQMVAEGLRGDGHAVAVLDLDHAAISFEVIRSGLVAAALEAAAAEDAVRGG
jgi:TusA-related sulfurtransferase